MTTGSRTEGLKGIGAEGFIRTVKNLTVTGDLVVHGETRSTVGTGYDVSAFWETADANANYWAYDLPSGGATAVPVMGVGIGLKDVDLGLFDGLTQPTLAVLDADRDSYLVLDFSADDSPRIRSNQDITVSGNVVFSDNITVNGTTTTVSSSVVVIDDPLFHLANDNPANSVDLGIIAEYTDSGKKFAGLFRDASDSDTWKLFATTGNSHEEPSTTVNTTSGFTLGNLAVNELAGTLTTASQTNITAVGTIATGTWEGTTIAVNQGGTGTTSLNNLITMGTHTTGDYVATITGGTGIDSDAATSGESTAHTLSIDLAEVGEVAIADGDYIAFMDTSDSNATKKEALADLVGLMAGTVTSTGISDSSSVLSVDIQNLTVTTTVDDADLVMIDDGAGGTLRKMTRAHLIESAALDAINIDGGAIDGVTIGTNSAVTQLVVDDLDLNGSTFSATATAHDTAGTAVIISAGDTTAGTTNNIAGGSLTIQGGQGKGSGAGGDIIFQTANAGASGSSVNSLVTALTISDDLSSTFAGAISMTGALTVDGDLDFTGPQEINTSSGALTLDATTDVIVPSGTGLLVGHTANLVVGGQNPEAQIVGGGIADNVLAMAHFGGDADRPASIYAALSRNASKGSHTIVQDDDQIFAINAYGSNGTHFSHAAASYRIEVDGTPGADSDMPGRHVWLNSPDGSATLAETMRLGNDGVLHLKVSADSVAVADEISIGRYEIGGGNTVLGISQETAVASDTDETKFSHKMQVRINGATYFIMLTDS